MKKNHIILLIIFITLIFISCQKIETPVLEIEGTSNIYLDSSNTAVYSIKKSEHISDVIIWDIINKDDVLDVDIEDGKVTINNEIEGNSKAYFTVLAYDSLNTSIKSTIGVTVHGRIISLEITGASTLAVGETIVLNAITTGTSNITWTISSLTLAEMVIVSNTKVSIKGLKPGIVTVTAKMNNQKIIDTHNLIIEEATEIIDLTVSLTGPTSLIIGENYKYIPVVSNNSIQIFTWLSSDETKATVSSAGVVTALKKGKVIITANILSTKITGSISIDILEPDPINMSIEGAEIINLNYSNESQYTISHDYTGSLLVNVLWSIVSGPESTINEGLLTVNEIGTIQIEASVSIGTINRIIYKTIEVINANTETEYIVIYDLNDSSILPATNSTDNYSKYLKNENIYLSNPEREGFAFRGWYLNDIFLDDNHLASNAYEGIITLKAKWINKYNIVGSMNSFETVLGDGIILVPLIVENSWDGHSYISNEIEIVSETTYKVRGDSLYSFPEGSGTERVIDLLGFYTFYFNDSFLELRADIVTINIILNNHFPLFENTNVFVLNKGSKINVQMFIKDEYLLENIYYDLEKLLLFDFDTPILSNIDIHVFYNELIY
ncbi:MAG: Ig-like domain-containing protein [Acholeplasmatales bacterium]|jgi:hypothetical protein|nr:Ig-like domain-containing protein [Acholeplasmatales bacterium]